jgi:hypothetical protein
MEAWTRIVCALAAFVQRSLRCTSDALLLQTAMRSAPDLRVDFDEPVGDIRVSCWPCDAPLARRRPYRVIFEPLIAEAWFGNQMLGIHAPVKSQKERRQSLQ